MCRMLAGRRTRGVDNGFTLIEILVALVVLTIGMLGLSRASLATLGANATNQRRIIATALVQDRLESIKRAGYAAATTASSTEAYGAIANHSGYKRVTVITNAPAPNMRTVTVTASWEQDRHMVSATTILAQ